MDCGYSARANQARPIKLAKLNWVDEGLAEEDWCGRISEVPCALVVMRSVRRAIPPAVAAKAVSGTSDTTFDHPSDLVAEAIYSGQGSFWRLHLFADYSARLGVEISGSTTGIVFGNFQFYDIKVVGRQQLEAFAKLRAVFAGPEPEIHPWTYGISLAIPKSRELHRVKVYVGSSMRVSNELRLFFAIWHNIWIGIPGAPSVPTAYSAPS